MTMTRDAHPTVLIVDDEIDIRLLVRTILESAALGVEVVGEAGDGIDAMSVYATLDPPEVPDVVILDNRMPRRDGMDVAREMLERVPDQHIVIFSAFVTPELEARAAELGVRACVGKSDFATLPDLVVKLSA